MHFEFATANRIVFGVGAVKEAGALMRGFGRRALIVTGRSSVRAERLAESLSPAGFSFETISIENEPTTSDILRGLAQARSGNCDCVVGIGGGSALDAAKAVAALLTNEGDLFDYLEVIGGGKPLNQPGVPCIAIPTTAGTGSEVTRNAVLLSPAHRLKVSLRSPHLLPRLALIDPELTYDLPAATTASTGLDALTQLIEPFVSNRANPMTDGFCREGIVRASRSLRQAVHEGRNAAAREDMALAGLLGGLALANSGLGAVHGLAAPIGGLLPAPHGMVCASLLPHVMEANVHALRSRAPESESLRRYDEVARLCTQKSDATADDGAQWIRFVVHELKIPTLSHHGMVLPMIPRIVTAAANASSMKANPIPLSATELTEILAQALHADSGGNPAT